MQADAEPGISLRDADRFVGARLVDHEAGLGEQAGLVMVFDGFVDDVAAAKIVAGQDEATRRRVFSIQFSVFSGAMQRVFSAKLNTEH